MPGPTRKQESKTMFVAIRYMEDEYHAIAEAIGPFDSLDAAERFIEQQWKHHFQDMCEAFELTPLKDYRP
jgi:hypothetical protein